jgi:hypothetical protein
MRGCCDRGNHLTDVLPPAIAAGHIHGLIYRSRVRLIQAEHRESLELTFHRPSDHERTTISYLESNSANVTVNT